MIGPEDWSRGVAKVSGNRIGLTELENYDPRAPNVGSALLFDLANLRATRDVQRFARKYGLLFAQAPAPSYSEPVDGWLVRAHELRAAIALYALMLELRQTESKEREVINLELAKTIGVFRGRLAYAGTEFLDRYGVAEQASIVIAEIVNSHLPQSRLATSVLFEQVDQHGHWAISAGAPPAFFWYPAFTDLVQYAHFMLALTVMDRLPVRLCKGCPRVFVPDPPDRLYHDQKCADTARQRKRRTTSRIN